jgi:hypothetical protein
MKRKSTNKMSGGGLSVKKKSTMKMVRDPSLSAPPESMVEAIAEEAALSPVTEKEGSSPPKSSRNTKRTPREEKRRGPKAKAADADAGDGKSSHGGGGAKALGKGNAATTLRIEKIEKYLHDRFDWLGIQKQEREQKKETSKERSKSNRTELRELPKLMNNMPKYKYRVDTMDKP